MPPVLTYPGVYVEEIPSGVRTITGVATAITAFLGRAICGPVNEPVTIFSFADFERQFGGLGHDYPMGYAVADFFQNGGAQAIIVRIFRGVTKDQKTSDGVGHTTFPSGLTLDAVSPGSWFNNIFAVADKGGITDEIASGFGLTRDDLFNLTINQMVDKQVVNLERFTNLSLKPDANSDGSLIPPVARTRRIDRVLQSSQFVAVQSPPDPKAKVPGDNEKTVPASGVSTDAVQRKPLPNPDAPQPPSQPAQPAASSPPASPGANASGSGTTTNPPPLQPGNDGAPLDPFNYVGEEGAKKGLYALEKADLFNLLCIPPDTRDGNTAADVYQRAMDYCQKRRAMLIVDPQVEWEATAAGAADATIKGLGDLGLTGPNARNAALYFPRVLATDLKTGQVNTNVPCGVVAGAMAATDAQRGVWKAPAGLDAALTGISGLAVNLTNDDNGRLNQLGVNCLRNFPIYGNVVWGARTMRGADQVADEYKYIPVRRLALYIEESLFRGTQWVVFEPNDEPLWAQIRLNVGAFMHNLFVKGAFQGTTPAAAYFVKCDKDTTTQNDIDLGVVNIRVGFAPLKPAEFVVLQIQQIAGDIQT
jgi:phage tail sheath protein FI